MQDPFKPHQVDQERAFRVPPAISPERSTILMKYLLLAGLIVLLLGLILVFTLGPRIADSRLNRFEQPPPYVVSEQARSLHERLFVADLHGDFLLWRRDLLTRYDRGHIDLPRLLEGGVGLQVFSVVTKSPWGQNYERTESDSDRITLLAILQRWPPAAWTSLRERALYQARRLHDAARRSEEKLTLIRTKGDFEAFLARRERDPDRVAALLAAEGLHPLEGRLANVDVLYEAGYRMMAPTHLFDNDLGGSASGVEKGGLTAFGREVIRRLDERQVLIDLAHASEAVIDDVLAMTTRPVVVSHTGVQGTCPGPRNLADRHIRAIAGRGGVIGIGFWEGAVCDTDPQAIARAIRYVADLAGVEHVGLGSDFDGTVQTRFDAAGLPLVTEALLEAGFSDDEIALIMGGNVRRLLLATLPER